MRAPRLLVPACLVALATLSASARAETPPPESPQPAPGNQQYPAYSPPPGTAPYPPPPGSYPPPPPGSYPPPPPGSYPPPPPGSYPPPPPGAYGPPPVTPEKHVGIGYKIGNGIGFVGADIIIAPVAHVALDLQANYASVDVSDGFTTQTAKGYGLAPSIQGRLNAGQVSTPYLGVGFLHVSLTLNDVTASGNGFFVNAGYEWRWDSGLGILLGGGISHLNSVHASNGVDMIEAGSSTHPNLEAGLRFMFL